MNSVTFVVPVFDEFLAVQDLLVEISKVKNPDVHFLFIDNGSSDYRLFSLLSSGDTRFFSSLRLESNQGFGGAICAGIAEVKTEYVGWMPGNLKVLPKDAVLLWESMRAQGFSFAKAKRVRRDNIQNAKTFLAGALHSWLFKANLFDAGGTPTLVKTAFMQNLLPVAPGGYEFEAFVLFALRKDRKYVWRPKIDYGVRKYGASHWQSGLAAEWRLFLRIAKERRSWRNL